MYPNVSIKKYNDKDNDFYEKYVGERKEFFGRNIRVNNMKLVFPFLSVLISPIRLLFFAFV